MFTLSLSISEDAAMLMAHFYEGDLTVNMPDKRNGFCRIEFYCRSREEAQKRKEELMRFVRCEKWRSSLNPVIKRLKSSDWNAVWKRQFAVHRVSKRIVIKPAWEKYAPRHGDCVVELEPGMSFGTGTHATTCMCLRLIDERQRIQTGAALLDAGCGSGILAIAAAKLGYARVTAIDNDTMAVKIARSNCMQNRVHKTVVCLPADVMRFHAAQGYDVIAANLYAPALVKAAGKLAGLLSGSKHACLILSGILAGQYAKVAEAFRKKLLREVKVLRKQGWVAAVFERKNI